MGCVQLSSPEERIRILTEKLRKFTDFAIAQMEWEAAVLNDDSPWFDRMPEAFMEKFEEVQRLRKEAMPI
jgi:hypothetical protein